jgi:hypothetical protein
LVLICDVLASRVLVLVNASLPMDFAFSIPLPNSHHYSKRNLQNFQQVWNPTQRTPSLSQ